LRAISRSHLGFPWSQIQDREGRFFEISNECWHSSRFSEASLGQKAIIKPLKELLSSENRKYIGGNAIYEFFVVKIVINSLRWAKPISGKEIT